MNELPVFRELRSGTRNNAPGSQPWLRAMASVIAIIGIVVLTTACGSGGSLATTSATPTTTSTDGTQATATDTTTPAADATTPTADSGATSAAQTTSGGVTPTVAVAPTQAPVPAPAPAAAPASSGKTVTVWIQVTDSCKTALPGGTFTVTGPGVNMTTAPSAGSNPVGMGSPTCPIQQGNCGISTGCTTATLNVPTSGTATYKITIAKTAPGGFNGNLSFAVCEGGSDCPHGPEIATVNVNSSGAISATTLNIYPDGIPVTWPTTKASYSGAKADPVMFHEFGIGNGSIPCDGDHDADDKLTGTPGMHCDSDKD